MSFRPASFEEALAKQRARPARQRTPMKRHGGGGAYLRRQKMRARKFSKEPSVDGDPGKRVKDDLDQLVRDILALRDDRCFTCGAGRDTVALEVGHLFRRGHEPIRWDLRNVAAQDNRCNLLHNEHPEIYIEKFLQRFGESAYNELRQLSFSARKLSYTELLEIRDGLRKELATMKEKR